jgi:hypothetical protein
MYNNQFAACVKVGGKVLRETSGTVSIPFGAEYSVQLKNLKSVRMLVKVSVDGTDATDGTWLIVNPNSSVELERYIRNGNWDKGNRFKFIERTAEIEQFRGIKADDGLIRIEYKAEIVPEQKPIKPAYDYDDWNIPDFPDFPKWPEPKRPKPWSDKPYWHELYKSGRWGILRRQASASSAKITGQSMGSAESFSISHDSLDVPTSEKTLNDTGITVPGSESSQKFVSGEYFPTESQSSVIVIKLRGDVEGKKVVKPITVEHKPQCSTCGKTGKSQDKFCANCGTSLVLI